MCVLWDRTHTDTRRTYKLSAVASGPPIKLTTYTPSIDSAINNPLQLFLETFHIYPPALVGANCCTSGNSVTWTGVWWKPTRAVLQFFFSLFVVLAGCVKHQSENSSERRAECCTMSRWLQWLNSNLKLTHNSEDLNSVNNSTRGILFHWSLYFCLEDCVSVGSKYFFSKCR